MLCSNDMLQKERKCNGCKMLRAAIHWVSLHPLLVNTPMPSQTYMHLYVCVYTTHTHTYMSELVQELLD